MKQTLLKTYFLPFTIGMLVLILAGGCKKDQLIIDRTKEYKEVGHVPMDAYDGGWRLTLKPDGVADVNPGGDIVYRGTYKINGSKIKVKTPQDDRSYTFEIISETEIREKKTGVRLKLRTGE